MKERIKKILGTRLTFMIVPHTSKGPVHINLSFSLLLFIFVTWTGITFWGSYLSAQHIDYWRAAVTNKALTLKVEYLLGQLEKNRGFIDEVKQMEAKLRTLLQYNSKSDIITDASLANAGGPTLEDQTDLSRLLSGDPMNVSWEKLFEKVSLLKNEAAARIESFENVTDYIHNQHQLFRNTPRGWPSKGYLSSHFGKRIDPFSGLREWHYGIDISGPTGTPVRATADGKIRLASWHSGYGKLVVVDHDFGYSTRYAHNGRLLVKPGDEVKRGQVIALMGNTGKSSGPHCHYEVWRYKKRLNPYAYLIGNFPDLGEQAASGDKKESSKKS